MTTPPQEPQKPQPPEVWKQAVLWWVVAVFAAFVVIDFVPMALDVMAYIRQCTSDACTIGDSSALAIVSKVILLVGGILTLYIANKRSEAMVRQAEAQTESMKLTREQLGLTREEMERNRDQLELTRRDHLSKRFTEGVKQLGDDSLTIRLGGIAGLWAVATESKEPADRIMVLDVLCAFIREQSQAVAKEREKEAASSSHDDGSQSEQNTEKPPADVAMAFVKVTSVDPWFQWEDIGSTRSQHNAYRRDLRNSTLKGIEAPNANLDYTLLYKADLSFSYLFKSTFRDSYLHHTNFSGSDLGGSKTLRVHFRECNFNKSNLSGTEIQVSDFIYCSFNDSDFGHSIIDDSSFLHCEFDKANLLYSKAIDSSFSHSRFNNSQLQRAVFYGTSLRFSDLSNADLSNADLSNAKISRAQLAQAKSIEGAKLPDTFLPDDPDAEEDDDAPDAPAPPPPPERG